MEHVLNVCPRPFNYLRRHKFSIPQSLMDAKWKIVSHNKKQLALRCEVDESHICLPYLDQLVLQYLLIPLAVLPAKE